MSSGTIEYDWTKTEPKILVDMIQADNTTVSVTEDMLLFGLPEQLTPTPESSYNSRVLVTATPSAPFYGSQFHYYHRVDINDFIFSGITNKIFFLEHHNTPALLAEALSQRLGVYLIGDKLEVTIPTEPSSVTVRIADSSLCYYGEFIVNYMWDIPDLSDIIKKTDIVGFFV